jgi:cytochrome b6-f complex iron-sulfur subunit
MAAEGKVSVEQSLCACRIDEGWSLPNRVGLRQSGSGLEAQPRRRRFFSLVFAAMLSSPLAAGFSTLAAALLMWLLGLGRFLFPNVAIERRAKFKAGFPHDYAPGQVETRRVAEFGVWVVRHEYEGRRQVYALQAVCTHLGCTPIWFESEQKFKCPCHGSGFSKDGINLQGPAPRPLERCAVGIADDGRLEVDTSRTFRQELGQWSDPASFVPL